MAQFVVRVGEQDDYHVEAELGDVIERLQMMRVEGPLTPYYCTSPVVSPEMRGKVLGFEAENYSGNHNYISLYIGDGGDGLDYLESLTDAQVEEINRALSS